MPGPGDRRARPDPGQGSGHHRAATALALPLLDRVTASALVSACLAVGTSSLATGQFTAGVATSERGQAAHLQLPARPPVGPFLHLTIPARCLCSLGRMAEGLALAQREDEAAVAEGSVEAQAFHGLVWALGLLWQGKLESAARLGSESAGGVRGWLEALGAQRLVRPGAMPWPCRGSGRRTGRAR